MVKATHPELKASDIQKVFKELAKFGPYVPVLDAQNQETLPPLRDPETGALISRFRYTDTSASVFLGS